MSEEAISPRRRPPPPEMPKPKVLVVDSGGTECTTLPKLIVDSGGTECTTLQKLIVDSEVRGTTLQKLIRAEKRSVRGFSIENLP